ncbi:MAG TPA: IucA/IucC family protein [Pilimelia sp.]|nr:IucA/IucC family protein [Pilimelia sp.]
MDDRGHTHVAVTRAALATARPDLLPGYEAALPAARAAVLARLWGALAREPIAGVAHRVRAGSTLDVALADGRSVRGPAAAAELLADPQAGLRLSVAGRAYGDPAELLRCLGLPGPTARLAAELDNSVANLALARAGRPAPDGGPPGLSRLAALPGDEALVAAEQWVVDGHPLHPGCRTRLGMSPAEVLAYGPEHRPVVALELVEVPAARWHTTGAGLPPLLPLHPWQRDHVLDAYPGLRRTGRRRLARPLLSLRTLAPLDDRRHHLKTAVDVQMTSAVRTVSAAAVHNGPALRTLFEALAPRLPGFAALAEPAAGAVLVDGAPCRSLAVVVRRAPRLVGPERAVPLAALAAPSPADGRPLVAEAVAAGYGGDPVAFLGALAAVLLPPLRRLLAHGVACEAHGQNTLVVLRAGRPVRLLYRDVGGVRISPARLRAAGLPVPRLRGDLVTDDPRELRTKLVAAVYVALAELVAALARHSAATPAALWRAVAAAAGGLFDGPVPVKATTAMRLAAEPLVDRWVDVAPPAGLR